MEQQMKDIRNRLLETLKRHDVAEHDGEPCIENIVGAIAFLAHAAGLRTYRKTDLEGLRYVMLEYESDCPFCKEAGGDHHW